MGHYDNAPTHIVADIDSGMSLFSVPAVIREDGLMTTKSAREYANLLNSERKPGYRTYRVFRLVPVTGGRRRTIR